MAWPRPVDPDEHVPLSWPNWRKTLLYIGPKEGGAAFGYSPESLVEAFGATEAEVAAALGPNWAVVSKAELPGLLRRAEEFLRGLQVRVKAAENAAAEPTARAST